MAGDISLVVNDTNSASVLVPSSSTIMVFGVCSASSPPSLLVSQNPNTFLSNCGYGPGVELAALLANVGATVLFAPLAPSTAGALVGASTTAVAITSTTEATPIAVTTTTAHGFVTGQVVTVAGSSETAANGTWTITVTGASAFTLNGSAGAVGAGTGGTAQPTGVVYTGTGTSVITMTLAGTVGCYDTYFVQVNVITGGTIGTGPIGVQVSLDAGRTFGSTTQLGTATTYQIPNTGITIDFGTGTLGTGDFFRFATSQPLWSASAVDAALLMFQASQYALQGVGNMILDGVLSSSNCSTIETNGLDVLATGLIFNRMMASAADVTVPTAWGGAGGQTEAAWIQALATAYGSTNTKRMCVTGGNYNMSSVFANSAAGTPLYRRPLSWALACRQVNIPPQRHAGRGKDGPLSQIVVNPTTDPTDGFVYHDERITSGLTAARFCAAKTRVKTTGGFYVDQPNLMAPSGSTVFLLPLGDVLDIACDIAAEVAVQDIDEDVRLNTNGTIYEADARTIESDFDDALSAQMVAANMVSSASAAVDRTANIEATNNVPINVAVQSRGYLLKETITVGFNT
jgi:hypothetical protein